MTTESFRDSYEIEEDLLTQGVGYETLAKYGDTGGFKALAEEQRQAQMTSQVQETEEEA